MLASREREGDQANNGFDSLDQSGIVAEGGWADRSSVLPAEAMFRLSVTSNTKPPCASAISRDHCLEKRPAPLQDPPKAPRDNRRQKIHRDTPRPLRSREVKVCFFARPEHRRMSTCHLFRRSTVAEVIERQRLARHARRAPQGIGMTMIGVVICAEDQNTVE